MDTFTFEFHDEVSTSHPAGIEVSYNVTAQAVAQHDYCPLAQMDLFSGISLDILQIEYNGLLLPCHMPKEPRFAAWIDRVKQKAREVYNRRSGKVFEGVHVTLYDVITINHG
jgi:hypothetical protein